MLEPDGALLQQEGLHLYTLIGTRSSDDDEEHGEIEKANHFGTMSPLMLEDNPADPLQDVCV